MEKISAESMDLSVTTGRIAVSDLTCAGDVKVNVSTGKADITDAGCRNFVSSGKTGDLLMKNVIAAEKLSVVRSTGDVKLEGCDAAEIFIETDTGDVTGTILSEKVFIVETDTGRIDVPKSANGGRCEITTDTGNVRISIR